MVIIFFILVALYTIEFQKCGLPYVHILLWLSSEDAYLNSIISIEISNKNSDHIGYETFAKFMMHIPYRSKNSRSSCMLKGYCSKYFPKEFRTETIIDENRFVVYRRRNDGHYITT